MDKLLQNQANTVQIDLGVEATGDVPVSILRGDGTTLTSGNATHTGGTSVYSYPLTPAQSAVLDRYVAVWTPTINGAVQTKRTYFEIAGQVYFAIAEAKALPGMSVIADQDIVEARQRIEELIEQKAGVAFVPRGRRATFYGRSTNELTLGDWFVRDVYSFATTYGTVTTEYGATELADLSFGSRRLFRKDGTVFPWGSCNISAHYEYGMDEPPEPVKRAALLMCQASFVLTDAEGNPTRPLSSVLTEIPEVQELLEPYIHKNTASSIQVGS